MYLSTALDDFSRYIIAWKRCGTMQAGGVTDTLDMALAESGCDQAHAHRLLSDNVLCQEAIGHFGKQVSMREFAPARC